MRGGKEEKKVEGSFFVFFERGGREEGKKGRREEGKREKGKEKKRKREGDLISKFKRFSKETAGFFSTFSISKREREREERERERKSEIEGKEEKD